MQLVHPLGLVAKSISAAMTRFDCASPPSQGHKVKNPKMQLVQQLGLIPVAVRVIISGTPIQNNLMEMHALFDFACEVSPGSLASIGL